MDNIERLERRHFAVPAAFVLTLLAFLFFGTSRPPTPAVPVVPVKTPPRTGDDVTKKNDDPPPLIAMEESDSVGKPVEAGGGPPPPVEIDQSWSQRQDVFFVPMERTRPHPGNGDIWMIPAYYGPGEGHGDHPGPANNIIPARLLDKPPQARSQASPVYPFKEKSESVTGTVEVECGGGHRPPRDAGPQLSCRNRRTSALRLHVGMTSSQF